MGEGRGWGVDGMIKNENEWINAFENAVVECVGHKRRMPYFCRTDYDW